MANFNSSFISNANIGNWDYYIFSDNVGIWRALNGLAAWFNSSGPLLQGAAWLGALIILAMAIFGAAVKKSTVSGGVLGTWFFFMSMMGITGQANVYNVYTNQVTVVQNIPALALVPASVFSKAAYKVFLSMDTAFQGVNGSYMSVSQFGFVGPLDLLLSLRSPRLATIKPALSQTLSQVVHDCAIDPNATGAAPPLKDDLDMLNWLTMYGRSSGLTRIFTDSDPSGNGTIVACKNGPGDPATSIGGTLYTGGLDYIDRQFEAMASGNSDLLKLTNAETTVRNPQDPKGLWNSSSMTNAYDMLIGSAIGMTQNAVQFSKNALVASTVTYTMDCMSQSGAMTSPESCASGSLALADSMEKWKTSAAMSGSGFLKTMFTSMGVLQALFFALFPIIAIYGLVFPLKTAKVFGGYIFFGIWCQSWMLTVAPVQSYIQTSITDQMSKMMAGSNGMTLANSMSVYQALSTKLAIAGDIMASSQMLSLALLSGSMVALSGLAQKWSGEKHMDTSKLQHDVSKSAPMVDHKPVNSVSSMADSNGNMTSLNNKVGAGSYSLQSNYIINSGETHSKDESYSHDKSRAKETAFQTQLMSKFGMSREQAASVTKTMTAMDQIQGQVGTGIAKALGGALGKLATGLKGGAPLTSGETAQMNQAVGKAQEKAITQLATKDAGFIDKLMGNAGREAQADAVGSVVDVAGGLLTAGMVAGEVLTGVGAAAAPATAIAMTAATQAAKVGLKSKIKSMAVETGKDVATNAAVRAVTGRPGGVEAFAKGIAGDTKAMFSATVQDAMKLDSSNTAKKSVGKDKTFSASDADKLAESWKEQTTESHSRSDGGSQTRTASVSLDKEQIMRAGLNGLGGVTGETLRQRASANSVMLRSLSSPEKVAAAMKEVDAATMGRTAQDFGGGSRGQALADYEQNVLFEHYLTGQVNGSMMNTEAGALLGGTVATVSKPAVATSQGHWQKIPRGQPGAVTTDQSTALRDWGMIDGNVPANQAAGAKAGMRWVPGTTAPVESAAVRGLTAGGLAAAAELTDASLTAPEKGAVRAAAVQAEQAAVVQLAGRDESFINKLNGGEGQQAQVAATAQVVDVASGILAQSLTQVMPTAAAANSGDIAGQISLTAGNVIAQNPGEGPQTTPIALAPKPNELPVEQHVPTGGLGQGVGNSPAFRANAPGFIARGDRDNQSTFDGLDSAEAARDQMAPAQVQEFHDKQKNEQIAIGAIGAAAVVAEAGGSFLEARRYSQGQPSEYPRQEPQQKSPGDKREGKSDPGDQKPQREPVNQRTRMGRMRR